MVLSKKKKSGRAQIIEASYQIIIKNQHRNILFFTFPPTSFRYVKKPRLTWVHKLKILSFQKEPVWHTTAQPNQTKEPSLPKLEHIAPSSCYLQLLQATEPPKKRVKLC